MENDLENFLNAMYEKHPWLGMQDPEDRTYRLIIEAFRAGQVNATEELMLALVSDLKKL